MLRQLSSSHDNAQSMVKYTSSIKHALSAVIVSWQRSEDVEISLKYLKYEACSISFHRLMIKDRAWLFIQNICNMLCQLSSPNDIGQSKVIPPQVSDMPDQLSSSELGNTSLRYELFCRFSSSNDNGQSMMIPYQVRVILCQLPSSHDNGRNLWYSLRYITCSVSCHRLMTVVREWKCI